MNEKDASARKGSIKVCTALMGVYNYTTLASLSGFERVRLPGSVASRNSLTPLACPNQTPRGYFAFRLQTEDGGRGGRIIAPSFPTLSTYPYVPFGMGIAPVLVQHTPILLMSTPFPLRHHSHLSMPPGCLGRLEQINTSSPPIQSDISHASPLFDNVDQ